MAALLGAGAELVVANRSAAALDEMVAAGAAAGAAVGASAKPAHAGWQKYASYALRRLASPHAAAPAGAGVGVVAEGAVTRSAPIAHRARRPHPPPVCARRTYLYTTLPHRHLAARTHDHT